MRKGGPRIGRRLLRPVKHAATKRKQTERERELSDQIEKEVINQTEISNRTLTSLQRLGSQMFPLRPYSDNFQLWTRSLNLTLSEFENAYAPLIDDEYAAKRRTMLESIQTSLEVKRQREKSTEETLRQLHDRLDLARRRLAEAESQLKQASRRLEMQGKKTLTSIKGEVVALEKRRARAEARRPSLLSRLFGRSKTEWEPEVMREIESKTEQMRNTKHTIKQQLNSLKQQHAEEIRKRKSEVDSLTSELQQKDAEVQIDDALDVRRACCDSLIALIQETLQKSERVSNPASQSSL